MVPATVTLPRLAREKRLIVKSHDVEMVRAGDGVVRSAARRTEEAETIRTLKFIRTLGHDREARVATPDERVGGGVDRGDDMFADILGREVLDGHEQFAEKHWVPLGTMVVDEFGGVLQCKKFQDELADGTAFRDRVVQLVDVGRRGKRVGALGENTDHVADLIAEALDHEPVGGLVQGDSVPKFDLSIIFHKLLRSQTLLIEPFYKQLEHAGLLFRNTDHPLLTLLEWAIKSTAEESGVLAEQLAVKAVLHFGLADEDGDLRRHADERFTVLLLVPLET